MEFNKPIEKDIPVCRVPKAPDVVTNPAHYNVGGVECIDVMLRTQGINAVMDFCLCNAFKYLYRHLYKNGLEDVKKAQWYIDKYIELESQKKEQEDH